MNLILSEFKVRFIAWDHGPSAQTYHFYDRHLVETFFINLYVWANTYNF